METVILGWRQGIDGWNGAMKMSRERRVLLSRHARDAVNGGSIGVREIRPSLDTHMPSLEPTDQDSW